MSFRLGRTCLLLLVLVTLTGCAGMGERGPIIQEDPQPLVFSSKPLPSGQFNAKADNVQILMDTSASMAVNDFENLQSAKNFVNSLNNSLPGDFAANTGLRLFGDNQQQSTGSTILTYGLAPYSRDEIKAVVEKIQHASGENTLAAAITAAVSDLENVDGTSALIIVSDGSWSWQDSSAAAKAAKERLGDRLCVYTVWVGDIVGTHRRLEKVVEESSCGFAETGVALTDQKALSEFVKKVFLTSKPIPVPVMVPPAVMETFALLFGFDKDAITDKMIPVLEQVKGILDDDPDVAFVVSGHADDIGSESYNQNLSERRADSVMVWLVEHGIAPCRLDSVGYGEAQPKQSNLSAGGRSLNRRVEIHTN